MQQHIKLAIVDDEEDFRMAVIDILRISGEFACVGAYGNGAVALVEIPKDKVDLVLMDIKMPGMSGVECTRRLKSVCPAIRVVMLTAVRDMNRAQESLRAGADGYLLKSLRIAALVPSIKLALAGDAPLSHYIADQFAGSCATSSATVAAWAFLTEREREIVNFLERGLFYKEIADRLSISEHTVTQHVHNIYEKLGVHTRTEALNKLYPRGG